MTEPTDVRELRERIERAEQMVDALCRPRGTEGAREWAMSIPARPDHDPDLVIGDGLGAGRAALERLEKLEALRSRLQMFLAAVGASTPDDHPWVVEARALANALRPCELYTPASASRAPRTPSVEEVEGAIGCTAGAWDMVDPAEIIEAVLRLSAAPTPQQGGEGD